MKYTNAPTSPDGRTLRADGRTLRAAERPALHARYELRAGADELTAWRAAACRAGLSLAAWIRQYLNAAAEVSL
jgi:hypothetical protein